MENSKGEYIKSNMGLIMMKNKPKTKRNLRESFVYHILRLFVLNYKFITLIILVNLIGILSPVLMSQIESESYTEGAFINQLNTKIPANAPPVPQIQKGDDASRIINMVREHSKILPLGVLQGFTFGGMFATIPPSLIEDKYLPVWTFGYTTGKVPYNPRYGEPMIVDMGGFLLGKIPHGIFELPAMFFIFAFGLLFGNYCYFRFKEFVKRYLRFYPDILSVIVYCFIFGMIVKTVAHNTTGMVGGVLLGIICLLIGRSMEDEYRTTSFFDIFKGLLATSVLCVLLLTIAATIEVLIDWNIIYRYFAEATLFGVVGAYGMTLFWVVAHIYAMKWVYKKGETLQTRKLLY